MSYTKIMKSGSPVREEDKRDGKLKFKYKIRCYDQQGREINRHVLAQNDREAARLEQELRADTSLREIRWEKAAEVFCDELATVRTSDYLKTVKRAVKGLTASIGNKLVEETTAQDLAQYFRGIRGTPRKAELQRSILLSVGRHLRKSFLVSALPLRRFRESSTRLRSGSLLVWMRSSRTIWRSTTTSARCSTS